MAHPIIDVTLNSKSQKELVLLKHEKFLAALEKHEDPMLDFLKMSGIYWSMTALDLMNKLHVINQEKIISFVVSCQRDDGGLSPAVGHDSHLLSTLSGLQILALYNRLDAIDADRIVEYIEKLQNPDGSFCGDSWGEVDSRFAFCALAALRILNRLEWRSEVEQGVKTAAIDAELTAAYLVRCQNMDGGFGTQPGSESHAGQAYCVIGALALLGQLRRLNTDKAAWWLAERQLPSGGLNGRPGKQPDVCYSWWVLSSLTILGRLTWIHDLDVARFILAAQDDDTGGIGDRPGNYPDPFHTLFGLAGLSLLSKNNRLTHRHDQHSSDGQVYESTMDAFQLVAANLKEINPVLCMPQHVIDRLSIKVQTLT